MPVLWRSDCCCNHGNSCCTAVLLTARCRLAVVVVTVSTRPLVVASATLVLGSAPCQMQEVRESARRFAQLGVKLSLFGTLPGGAPAWGTWSQGQSAGARLAQPGSFVRQGRGGTWRQLGFERCFERILLTGFVWGRGRWCQTWRKREIQRLVQDINFNGVIIQTYPNSPQLLPLSINSGRFMDSGHRYMLE